jgi:hypothetical protein
MAKVHATWLGTDTFKPLSVKIGQHLDIGKLRECDRDSRATRSFTPEIAKMPANFDGPPALPWRGLSSNTGILGFTSYFSTLMVVVLAGINTPGVIFPSASPFRCQTLGWRPNPPTRHAHTPIPLRGHADHAACGAQLLRRKARIAAELEDSYRGRRLQDRRRQKLDGLVGRLGMPLAVCRHGESTRRYIMGGHF